MSKFVMRRVPSGVKFDLTAGNGEVIASSEVYASENACRNGIASVRKNAPAASIDDGTGDTAAKVSCPKFEIFTDKRGAFRFRLKASNGQIIATSEGYSAKASCISGIDSVRKNAADAETASAE